MKASIISVGKLSKSMQSLADDYVKMTGWKINNIQLPHSKKQNEGDIKKDEASSILKKINKNSYVITLEIEGKQFESTEFSKIFANQMLAGKNIAFIIGGTFGLDESICKISNLKLSLSKMTMPHQLAKVFLLEQIYRAKSILDNHPYHK